MTDSIPTPDRASLASDVERVARAMYDDWPLRAISPALRAASGVGHGEPISWERSIEMGVDHSGLFRLARAAIAALASTPQAEAVEREREQWKAETARDLNEERNPGADDYAKGFNNGLIFARKLIYARIDSLFATSHPDDLIRKARDEAFEEAAKIVERWSEQAGSYYSHSELEELGDETAKEIRSLSSEGEGR